MITVVERSGGGYTVADDGRVLAHLSNAKADELRAKLADALSPVSTTAVSPAKARFRPPIQRYPIKSSR